MNGFVRPESMERITTKELALKFIDEQVKKILAMANIKTDSEQ